MDRSLEDYLTQTLELFQDILDLRSIFVNVLWACELTVALTTQRPKLPF